MAAGLTLSREWLALFDALPDDTARGRLLRAVAGYAIYGIQPKGLTETEQGYFARMRKTIVTRRRNERAYQNRMIHTLSPSKPHDSYAPEPPKSNQHRTHTNVSPLLSNKLLSSPQGEKPSKNDALPRTARRFVPPTVEEVAAYCRERNNEIDPQQFIDHHEAVGWVIGKNKTPVKNWRAVVRQWERTEKETKDKNKPKKRDYSGF